MPKIDEDGNVSFSTDYYEFLKPSKQPYFKNLEYEETPYQNNDKFVPRVTSIVDCYRDNEALRKWQRRMYQIGKDPEEFRKAAADLGSKTHKGIEMFLKNQPVPEDTPLYPFQSFLSWWSLLSSKFNLEILGQETKLVVDEFGGTYDLLLRINDKIYIIDFKTSSSIHFEYFIQLAAYAFMLRQQNIFVNGYMLLHLSRNKNEFKEYVLDYSIPSHLEYAQICENAYMIALSKFNHEIVLKERFKHEKWVPQFY